MRKHNDINALLRGGSERLTNLRRRSEKRSEVLGLVCAALPPRLAAQVASAGIEHGRLTLGVIGASWAARLRYLTEGLRADVGRALGVDITAVRLKVVPPPPAPGAPV